MHKTDAQTRQVGWYGLGSMGIGMAINLQGHLQSTNGPALLYSNRTLSRGEPLEAAGASEVADFAGLVGKCDVIFTMISNDTVLKDLVAVAVNVARPGMIFVDTSTVHPDTSAFASAELSKSGVVFIASPVFGASAAAAAGNLIFAMAGPSNAIESVRTLVQDVMGRKIIDCGEDVRKSSLLKIAGNTMVIGLQELIAEVQVFAEKTDLTTGVMEQFIGEMFGPVAESYSKRITTGAYAPPLDTRPGFAVSLAIKDVKHALNLANSHEMRLPISEVALSHLANARNFAGDNLDSSSIYGTIRVESGMPFWSKQSRQGN